MVRVKSVLEAHRLSTRYSSDDIGYMIELQCKKMLNRVQYNVQYNGLNGVQYNMLNRVQYNVQYNRADVVQHNGPNRVQYNTLNRVQCSY